MSCRHDWAWGRQDWLRTRGRRRIDNRDPPAPLTFHGPLQRLNGFRERKACLCILRITKHLQGFAVREGEIIHKGLGFLGGFGGEFESEGGTFFTGL